MTVELGTPNVAEHRGWRLPGQGTGSRRGGGASSNDRYASALRTLSSQAGTPVDVVNNPPPMPYTTGADASAVTAAGVPAAGGVAPVLGTPQGGVAPLNASPLGQTVDTTA